MNVHEKRLPLKLKITSLVPKDRMGEPLAATRGGAARTSGSLRRRGDGQAHLCTGVDEEAAVGGVVEEVECGGRLTGHCSCLRWPPTQFPGT